MRLFAKTICLCFALLLFSGCEQGAQTLVVYKKYPRSNIPMPDIEPKCTDVACALVNYQKQKDYAANLRDALDEVTE